MIPDGAMVAGSLDIVLDEGDVADDALGGELSELFCSCCPDGRRGPRVQKEKEPVQSVGRV